MADVHLRPGGLDRINVLNNPVNMIDPYGLTGFVGALPAIIGGAFNAAAAASAAATAGAAYAIIKILGPADLAGPEDDMIPLPNISPGGGCPNGDDDEDGTLQSRGNKINKRTSDYFGKNRREVGRALEALKRENGLRNDFHETRIMKSGDVINKNTNQVIDNLWNYMH